MADRPIIMPRMLQRRGNNRFETFGGTIGIVDNHASAPWIAGRQPGEGTIVCITAGVLNPVVTDGVLACGIVQEVSAATAVPNPPTTMKDPSLHFPWNLADVLFLLNITDASGNVGEAAGAPILSEAVIGGQYAMFRPTSGTYTKYQMLDVDDTTNKLFEVVAKPTLIDGIANVAATFNGLVLARIIPSKLQLVG